MQYLQFILHLHCNCNIQKSLKILHKIYIYIYIHRVSGNNPPNISWVDRAD